MLNFRNIARGCAVAVVTLMGASSVAHADNHKASLAENLSEIMSWWNGDYDNNAQLKALEAAGRPIWREDGSGEGGHIEVTSHYRPISLPAFGENVVYVEETKHGDPNNIFRQRIYTLTADEENQVVRVKLWYFKDKEKYVGAWNDMSRLANLTPEEMFPLQDECDLLGVKTEGRYHMPMADKACVFGKRYFSYQVLLGPGSFWFRDKIVSIEDESNVESAGDFTYHELDKIQ